MKRLVLAVIAALTAISAPAQATGPVEVPFADGRGVTVSETSHYKLARDKITYTTLAAGVIGFSDSAAVTHDLTRTFKITPEMEKELSEQELEYARQPLREIKVGRYTYVNPFEWGPMPAGTKWVRFGGNAHWGSEGQRANQLVDVFDPAVLKRVLSRATLVGDGEYRGVLRRKDLPLFTDAHSIAFRLFLDHERRPIRLFTEFTEDAYVLNDDETDLVRTTAHVVVDTRYTQWGRKVHVVAPPKNEVVDFNKLDPSDWPKPDPWRLVG
ncbi:hypothetical protein ACIBG8_42715 [Nonomuraea sp. NPDC050556]|uniref:hypothetical protein n=1 Tax=Nonomuraea sp. NPDC050556 TaxID=3364369 RepID=UPI0037AC0B6F